MFKALLLLSSVFLAAASANEARLDEYQIGPFNEEDRDERNLLNTFPFNAQVQEETELEPEEGHAKSLLSSFPFNQKKEKTPSQDLPTLSNRQGYGPVTEPPVSTTTPNVFTLPPKKCIDKVEMTTTTVFDDVIKCDHSYDRQCHTSYTTTYEAQQEEECEENYRKSCYIDYEDVAFNQTVRVCRRPMMKPTDCEAEDQETVCRTIYESECWTKQHETKVTDDVPVCEDVSEEVCQPLTVGYTTENKCETITRQQCTVQSEERTKYSPVTSCTKEPREICASAGCNLVEGDEVCHDAMKTIVQEKPIESCNIEPVRVCQHVTKLVPRLKPMEECSDVPKEICSRMRTNPRVVKKPVIKKWCYVPTEESGLA